MDGWHIIMDIEACAARECGISYLVVLLASWWWRFGGLSKYSFWGVEQVLYYSFGGLSKYYIIVLGG